MPERTPGPRPSALTRWVRANALFSGLSGIAVAAASGALPSVMGAGGRGLYLAVGLGLAAYGPYLWWRSGRVGRAEGRAIVGGDVLWVAGSAAVLLAGVLAPVGAALVAGAAVVVAAFAVGQARSLGGLDEGPPGRPVQRPAGPAQPRSRQPPGPRRTRTTSPTSAASRKRTARSSGL